MARVAAFAPEWSNPSDRDPGITLLELFEFLGESLLDRANQIPEARARMRDVLERFERADDHRCADATLSRNRYFTGKLLSADDLAREQDYERVRHRRHNRLLHGVGIVRGFGISLEPCAAGDQPAIVVSPGVAIGPDGEELVVCEPVTRDLCPTGPCYVTLRLVERTAAATPDGEPSRIDESADVAVTEDGVEGNLVIGRVIRVEGAWRLDPSFHPRHV